MNRTLLRLLPLAAGLLAAGCLVRSVHPWLADASRTQETALLGAWRDDKAKTTAVFSAAGDGCEIAATDGMGRTSRLAASLHRLGDTLLLQVGPTDPEGLHGFVLLPAHILYRVALDGDSLALFPVDPASFEARAAQARLPLLAESSPDDGYVLTGPTADTEAFLRTQLADPAFFAPEPHYTFRRLPAPAD